MKTYRGGEKVEPGLYLHTREWAFKDLQDEAILPGTARDSYRRVPPAAMLVVGPVVGLAYVMFLPLVGVGMVLSLLGVKAAHAAAGPAEALVRALRPGWEPALAFLSRAKGTKKAAGPTADAWAAGVREKLEAPESPEEPRA